MQNKKVSLTKEEIRKLSEQEQKRYFKGEEEFKKAAKLAEEKVSGVKPE